MELKIQNEVNKPKKTEETSIQTAIGACDNVELQRTSNKRKRDAEKSTPTKKIRSDAMRKDSECIKLDKKPKKRKRDVESLRDDKKKCSQYDSNKKIRLDEMRQDSEYIKLDKRPKKRKHDVEDLSNAKTKCIRYDSSKKIEISLSISKEEWDQILNPETVRHKDRSTQKFQSGWTHYFIENLWIKHCIPCPFAFKNHKFLKKSNSPFLTFTGNCHECGNPIDGYITRNLPLQFPVEVIINTHDTSGLVHETNTNLAGERREEEQRSKLHKKPTRQRDELAADILNDSGTKPPYYVTTTVLSTARREALIKECGGEKYPGDSITAIIAMKKDFSCIRRISASPLIVYYWSENQKRLWNDANSSHVLHFSISIDATGSVVRIIKLVDDLKTGAIFLYNITIRIGDKVYSICQMLSSKHDNKTIRDWLEAWLNSGASCPLECIVDCSYALLIAVCKAFNKCHYLKFINDCHLYERKKCKKLPLCWVRRDRAHLIKAMCIWKCFAGDNWRLKDFYVRVIAYALEIELLSELSELILAVFVVCQSEFIDDGSECHKKFTLLEDKIRHFNHKQAYKTDSSKDHLDCEHGSCTMVDETDGSNNNDFITADIQVEETSAEAYVHNLKIKSNDLLTKGSTYKKANNYYLPEIMKNLITLMNQYPSWTNVMRKHYAPSFKANKVATSTGSEIYFRILKVDYKLVSCSIKQMLLQHIKLLDGSTKHARGVLKKLIIKAKQTNSDVDPEVQLTSRAVESPEKHEKDNDHPTTKPVASIDIKAVSSSGEKKENGMEEGKSLKSSKTVQRSSGCDYLVQFAHYYYPNLPYLMGDNELCSLSLESLQSLNGKAFIRGETIDSMMAILKRSHDWDDIFVIPTHETNFIMGDACHLQHGEEWAMYHINFNFYGTVFLPYCYRRHWRFVMLKVEEKKIYHYDPIPIQNDIERKQQEEERRRAIGALIKHLQECDRIANFSGNQKNNLTSIKWQWSEKVEPLGDFPRQSDGHSCGPLIIYYMRLLSGSRRIDRFDPVNSRLEIKKVLASNYDSVNLTCVYCYNRKRLDIVICDSCLRWAHKTCIDRHVVEGEVIKKALGRGKCEVCLSKL